MFSFYSSACITSDFSLMTVMGHCVCSIGRYTRDLPRSTVDSLLESAFSVWARASRLTFVRSHSRSADIMVEFVTSGGFLLQDRDNVWKWTEKLESCSHNISCFM